MPDHAKKLGEAAANLRVAADWFEKIYPTLGKPDTNTEVQDDLRKYAALLDALGPVVSQLVNSNGLIYAVERDDAEALLAAVEKLR